jgi:hypothetical protein
MMKEECKKTLRRLLSDDEDQCGTRHRILSDEERDAIRTTLGQVGDDYIKRIAIEGEMTRNPEYNENANLLP